jgi:hypothetical protein
LRTHALRLLHCVMPSESTTSNQRAAVFDIERTSITLPPSL